MAMAKDYPFAITAKKRGKKATVRITGVIWNWHNNAEQFRLQVEKYNAEGVDHLHLYINSPGGSVIEANEIVNVIRGFKGKVTGEGGALVASAGTYIALECETFELSPNGQWMYHKPMADIRGNEDHVESQLKALKNFTADYKKRYAAKSNLSEAQIEKKWVKGDVWLNADEALKDGFITGIKKAPEQITEDTAALFAACGCPTAYKADPKPADPAPQPTNPAPQPKNPKLNPNSMTELQALAIKLGLPQDATQAQVDAKVKELQAQASKAETLEKEAKDQADAEQAQAVKDLLDGAVKDKKLTAEQAKGMEGWANSDFEGCKAHIESLPTIEAISQNIKGNATPSAAAAAVAEKSFDALTQEEIANLEENDPEALQAKYEAYLNASNEK